MQAIDRQIDSWVSRASIHDAHAISLSIVQAVSARYVYAWREQAELERRVRGEGAMDAEQVVKFIK